MSAATWGRPGATLLNTVTLCAQAVRNLSQWEAADGYPRPLYA